MFGGQGRERETKVPKCYNLVNLDKWYTYVLCYSRDFPVNLEGKKNVVYLRGNEME